MPAPLKERKAATDPTNVFHYTDLQRKKPTRENDPYTYMHGWNNRHQSEVIPGTLPVAQNNPQEVRFGLYTEGITYSAFAAPRAYNYSTYMYRVRPAAAHSMYPPIWRLQLDLTYFRWLQEDRIKGTHSKLLPLPQPRSPNSPRTSRMGPLSSSWRL